RHDLHSFPTRRSSDLDKSFQPPDDNSRHIAAYKHPGRPDWHRRPPLQPRPLHCHTDFQAFVERNLEGNNTATHSSVPARRVSDLDRKSTRLNSSHVKI